MNASQTEIIAEYMIQLDGSIKIDSSINDTVSQSVGQKIPEFITENRSYTIIRDCNETFWIYKPVRKPIKRDNKLLTAATLPVLLNLNPQSLYYKSEEFKDMMNQLDVDIYFISESWDREHEPLQSIIGMEGYIIFKNVLQRRRLPGH
jgi:hypothetical protein